MCIADFWVMPGVFIDFDIAANRALFHDLVTGDPVDLGANGELPTGSPPPIFLSGGKGDFPLNKGTAGEFYVTRNLENCLEGFRNIVPAAPRTRGGVHLNGTGTIVMESSSDVSDSATGTFSFWLRMSSLPSASGSSIYSQKFGSNSSGVGGTVAVNILLASTGFLTVYLGRPTGAVQTWLLTKTQTNHALTADSKWHHVAMSWDTQSGAFQLYVDRIAATTSSAGTPGFNVTYGAFGFSDLWWFGTPSGYQGYLGDVAEMWGDLTTKIDLSVAANFDKLCSPTLQSTDVGPDGSLPLGFAPTYYFSQSPIGYEAITFMINRARNPVQWGVNNGGGTDYITVAPPLYT